MVVDFWGCCGLVWWMLFMNGQNQVNAEMQMSFNVLLSTFTPPDIWYQYHTHNLLSSPSHHHLKFLVSWKVNENENSDWVVCIDFPIFCCCSCSRYIQLHFTNTLCGFLSSGLFKFTRSPSIGCPWIIFIAPTQDAVPDKRRETNCEYKIIPRLITIFFILRVPFPCKFMVVRYLIAHFGFVFTGLRFSFTHYEWHRSRLIIASFEYCFIFCGLLTCSQVY